jgi:hypothetical protein
VGKPDRSEAEGGLSNSPCLWDHRTPCYAGRADAPGVDTRYRPAWWAAGNDPPSESTPANFSHGCEKFDFVEDSDGRGGEIRTPDPLLPKRDGRFPECRLQGYDFKYLKGKGINSGHNMT